MRRAAKVDANQTQIVSALRAAGVSVQSLAAVGNGVPDLLCGFRGRLSLMEIKDGNKVPSARKLTPAQNDWHAIWKDMPLYVVETPEQALRVLGVIA